MELLNRLSEMLQVGPDLQLRLMKSIAAILFLWLVHRIIIYLINRTAQDARILYKWRKTSAYTAFIIGVFVVGRIWFEGIQSFSTFLGLLTAGLALALKDPIANLAGWAFILWRRPFEVGDRIQIGDMSGDVIDLRIFQFTLLEIGNWVDGDQSTGRVIHVPNGRVFTQPQCNYTQGFQFIWDEIPIHITFESNWQKARSILEDIAIRQTSHRSHAAEARLKEAAQKFMIFYNKLTPVVYTSIVQNGVRLTIRYLCEPRQRRSSAVAIWEEVLSAFAQHPDIRFAYPTQRMFFNPAENSAAPPATWHVTYDPHIDNPPPTKNPAP